MFHGISQDLHAPAHTWIFETTHKLTYNLYYQRAVCLQRFCPRVSWKGLGLVNIIFGSVFWLTLLYYVPKDSILLDGNAREKDGNAYAESTRLRNNSYNSF